MPTSPHNHSLRAVLTTLPALPRIPPVSCLPACLPAESMPDWFAGASLPMAAGKPRPQHPLACSAESSLSMSMGVSLSSTPALESSLGGSLATSSDCLPLDRTLSSLSLTSEDMSQVGIQAGSPGR